MALSSNSYIKIGETELPPPVRGVNVIVSTNVDSGRNADGELVGQRVGRDIYKINDLEWPWLTAAQWESILQLVKGFTFDVTFVDPVNIDNTTTRLKKVKMYCGDRSAEPYWVDEHGRPTHYRNCKMNLIDCGVM